MSSNLFWYDVYQDDETFWSAYNGSAIPAGTGFTTSVSEETTIVKSGTSSLKISPVSGGNYDYGGARHTYGSVQDWSAYNCINFMFYGSNSNESWGLYIYGDNPYPSNNFLFTDDFTGWQIKSWLYDLPTSKSGGGHDFSAVKIASLHITGIVNETINYLGRMWLSRYGYDVARWMT